MLIFLPAFICKIEESLERRDGLKDLEVRAKIILK